ncbi:uncharacterized protein ACNFOS_003404 [Eudromia elegans]
MGARAALMPLLAAVMLLTILGSRADECDQGEYLHEGYCCKSCPAGYYVAQHCSATHLRAICAPCIEGEDYTAHPNGLEKCLPCKQCKDDQITLKTCTLTRDTECQCKRGYFCPFEGCEICQKCNTREREFNENAKYEGTTESLISSEVEKVANNAAETENEKSGESLEGQAPTSVNSEVGNKSPEDDSAGLSEKSTMLPRSLRFQIERAWKRLRNPSLSAKPRQNPTFHLNACLKAATSRMPANRVVKEPKYEIIVKDLSQKELRASFRAFLNNVPLENWMSLMRTHLKENAINQIIYEHPYDIEEQNYQMLLIWKNTLGDKQSIIKLLNELRYIDTKAYDNVLNTLKSNNIITKLQVTE